MNVNETMQLRYADLPDGATTAGELCPSCNGGRTAERTLSVSRSGDVLLWHCHRASCHFSGSSTSRYRGRTRTESVECRGVVGRNYVRTAVSIPWHVREYLSTKLYLTDVNVSKWQLGWDEETSRLVQPVFSPSGEILGCQLRALDGRKPKAISHTEQGAIAWFIKRGTPGLIIVEDIFSAIRLADHVSSVALLSTHLNHERVGQIKRAGLSPVWLALDHDAWPKTIQYVKEFRNQIRLLPMKIIKDFKSMTPIELEETLNANRATGL